MREYRYLVRKDELQFEIIVLARNDRHADMQAAEIGMKLGIMLLR